MRACLFGTYNRKHTANIIYAAAVRAAGYERPFTELEDGVGRYLRGHLATQDPYR